jgi:hypothetical protein
MHDLQVELFVFTQRNSTATGHVKRNPIRVTEFEIILARGLVPVVFFMRDTHWSSGSEGCEISIKNHCPVIHPSAQWNEQVDQRLYFNCLTMKPRQHMPKQAK